MTSGLFNLLMLSALEVRWLGPESCPAPDLAPVSTTSSGVAEVRLTSPAPAAWLLELTFLEPFHATRRLELGSCADARRAVRVLLVLGLKGNDAFQQTEPALTGPPLTTREPIDAAATTGDAPPALVLSVHLGALATFLTVPAATPRVTLGAAVRRGVFEVELVARAGVPAAFAGGPTSTAAVSVWPVVGGELSGCFSPMVGPLRLGACATLVGEWWRLEGQGVSAPAAGDAALVGLGGQGRVGFVLGGAFEAGLSATARGNLWRPAARFGALEALQASPFSLEAAAWVGWSP